MSQISALEIFEALAKKSLATDSSHQLLDVRFRYIAFFSRRARSWCVNVRLIFGGAHFVHRNRHSDQSSLCNEFIKNNIKKGS
ncbi:MAG: hypothetical protein EBY74_03815, partial [Actinobacteria bacterium]|nr:hypothetical protein [Actinomycetota bacterium]